MLLLLRARCHPLLVGQRKTGQYTRAERGNWSYLARPTEFDRALAHRGHAHTGTTIFWKPHAVVYYLQSKRIFGPIDPEADAAGVGLRVPRDVVHGLLSDAVAGHLDGSWQRREVLWGLDGEDQPTFAALLSFCFFLRELLREQAVTGSLLADGGDEAQVVERGRAQAVDEATDVRGCLLRLALELG
jgi:hypothetical protein